MIVENDTILISTIDDGIVVVNYTFGSGGLILLTLENSLKSTQIIFFLVIQLQIWN